MFRLGLLYASLCVLWCSTVEATIIDFNASPSASQPGAIAFGADGSLTGAIPLTSITGGSTTLAIADGVIGFSFEDPHPLGSGFYYTGGIFGIVGTLPGGSSSQVLLSGTFIADAQLTPFGPALPTSWFLPGGAVFTATIAQDLATLFGEPTSQRGDMTILFSQATPGGPTVLSGARLEVGTTGVVPEPASLLLVVVGSIALASGSSLNSLIRRKAVRNTGNSHDSRHAIEGVISA